MEVSSKLLPHDIDLSEGKTEAFGRRVIQLQKFDTLGLYCLTLVHYGPELPERNTIQIRTNLNYRYRSTDKPVSLCIAL